MNTIKEIAEEIREQAQNVASTSDIVSLINEIQRWIPVEEKRPPAETKKNCENFQ